MKKAGENFSRAVGLILQFGGVLGGLVSASRLIAVVGPDSAPVKRLISEARERSMLIDAFPG